MKLRSVVPILRSFDEREARAYYVEFLGFKVDWEHRFENGFPLYMQVSRDNAVLHLSEHHGDCAPGGAVKIPVDDIEAVLADITSRPHPRQRPAIVDQTWGTREILLIDPFSNRVVFYQDGP